MTDFKTIIRRVPQPYKTWIARPVMICLITVTIPIAAVMDAVEWCKEIRGEVTEMWHEIEEW